jgi:hypothetical protein
MSQHSWSSARKFSWMLTVASALGVSTAAEAANVFSITGATSAFTTSDATFGSLLTSINTATDSLTATVNNTMFADATLQSLLSGMAEGASHGTKSIVADYGSNPSLFSVGAGGVFSIYPGFSSLNLGTSTGLPSFGVNAQAALSVGLSLGLFLGNRSLGPIALNRLTLYGSFMTFNTQISSLTLGMTNFSVRGQYKLFPPIGPSFLAQWGGIDVGLGVEYSTSTIGLQTALTQSVAGTDFTTTWASTFNLGLKASTFTVPVEVSTNATLLYVVTAFAGLGFDLNFGGATTYGGATGPITVNYTGALPIGSQNLYSATGTLNLEGQMNVAPSAADMRFFVGGQFNLWLLKIAGVFNYQTNSVYSGSLIARVAM